MSDEVDRPRLAPAIDPDGKEFDHECPFREILRLIAEMVGVTQNENGNYDARELDDRLQALIVPMQIIAQINPREMDLVQLASEMFVEIENEWGVGASLTEGFRTRLDATSASMPTATLRERQLASQVSDLLTKLATGMLELAKARGRDLTDDEHQLLSDYREELDETLCVGGHELYEPHISVLDKTAGKPA